jgi:DNA-binding CsgD family transcriptional regulator/PAS domain-containing protein
MHATQPKAKYDPQTLTDLLRASFQLHLGHITDEQWLGIFTKAVDCNASACVRWTRGNSDYAITSTYGEHAELPEGWKDWVDHTVASSSYRKPGLIESFTAETPAPITPLMNEIDKDRILIGIVDWEPACIVMVMARNKNQPKWTTFEKQHILRILEATRDSIQVHKELDRRRYIGGLAHDVLNSSPRGILALSEDGVIQMANTQAEFLLDQGDGVKRIHGKLLFSDSATQASLNDYLSNLATATGKGLPEMDWNMAAKRPSGETPYQVIIGSLKLQNWNVESRASDRVAMLYLLDARNTTRPSDEQLKAFYGLTSAQARVAAALYAGNNINEAAEALHISVNTARSHMRNIYGKVGVRTQAELLGLLASGLKTYGKTKN